MTRIAFITAAVFLVLKLAGAVAWEWGYVLLPAAWVVGAFAREVEIEKATGRKIDVGI